MKKITSLIALFLVVLGINAQELTRITSLDQVDSKKAYTIVATRSAFCVSADGTRFTSIHEAGVEQSKTDENQQFAFVKQDNGDFYLYSVGAKKFVKKNCSLDALTGDVITFVKGTHGNRGECVRFKLGTGNVSFSNNAKKTVAVDGWSYIDDGNDCYIEPVADFEFVASESVLVTYVYKYNGKEISKKEVSQVVGSAYNAPGMAFMNLQYTEGVAQKDAENVVEVTCAEKLPFVKTVDQKDPKWYLLDIHFSDTGIKNACYYWKYDAANDRVIVDNMHPNNTHQVDDPSAYKEMSAIGNDAYYWCIMGDVVTGFKLYNKAKGFDFALTHSNPASLGVAKDATLWKLDMSTDGTAKKDARTFCLAGEGFSGTEKYINKNGKFGDGAMTLGYWSAADGGSSCRMINGVEALDAVAKSVMTPANALGGYSFFNTPANAQKFVEDYNALIADPFSVVAAGNVVANINKVKASAMNPSEVKVGTFYRIKNYCRNLKDGNKAQVGLGGYMSSAYHNTDRAVTCHSNNIDEAGAIWVFETHPNVADAYALKNLNTNLYLKDNAVEFGAEAGNYKLQKGAYVGSFKLVNGTQHLHASTGGVMFYDEAGASDWFIVPATELEVAMNAAEGATWASLYLPFGVKLNGDVKAYAGKVNGDVLKLTEVAEVPANYAVVLKGAADKYTLTIDAAAATAVENGLLGTNVAKPVAEVANAVVLGAVNEVVGFYAPKGENLLANKAYAVVEGAAAVNGLKFVFGEATGVEGVEVENAKAVYYDLSGRRVANPTKGIYVVNGKKVYVK